MGVFKERPRISLAFDEDDFFDKSKTIVCGTDLSNSSCHALIPLHRNRYHFGRLGPTEEEGQVNSRVSSSHTPKEGQQILDVRCSSFAACP
jgi:hypothetical protein